ncbi:MAG: MFS transporter [Candidatus Thorarchaeota archaeon]
MSEQVENSLTPDQTQQALSKMVKQGVAVQVKTTLTEGVFLVGFALLLGAPNIVIGILAAVPSLVQLLQIPAVILVEKIGERRRVNFVTQLGNRLAVLFMALIPFLGSFSGSYLLLVLAVGIQGVFSAIGAPSWNSWLRDLVPDAQLGRFFSRRMALTSFVAIIVSLGGGYFIGEWYSLGAEASMLGYAILFLIAFLAGMLAVYYTSTTPEPKLQFPSVKTKFSELIRRPFDDKNFRNLMWFSVVWTLSTSLAASFFAVYLLGRLGLGLFLATILTALTQMVSIVFFRFWGRLSDKLTNKSILQFSTPLFILGTFLWTFTSVATTYSVVIPLLVIIHLISGFSAAGVNLTSSNIGLKLAPRGQATSYLAARGAFIAVAGTIGPLIGGVLADLFANHTLEFALTWYGLNGEVILFLPTYRITGLDFVFILSAIVGIYALHRLAYVTEVGEVEEKIVLDAIIAETRRNVRTLTTIDGLRHTFQVPLSDIRKKSRRKKIQEHSKADTADAKGEQKT